MPGHRSTFLLAGNKGQLQQLWPAQIADDKTAKERSLLQRAGLAAYSGFMSRGRLLLTVLLVLLTVASLRPGLHFRFCGPG